jgi:acyl-coenzyme A synthetase/AMP-(fatty) acid ligase
MWLYLAFVLVAEETMTQKKRVAAAAPEVIAAVSAHLASAALGAGEVVVQQAHD